MKKIISRSDCPVSYTLDFLGDKWTILILRDIIFEGKASYGEFLLSAEGIATNILADRLAMLETNDFVTKTVSAINRSKFIYTLTEKGISLLPMITEIMIWGSQNSPAGGNKELLKQLKKDKKGTIKEITKMLKKRISAKE